MKKHYTKRQIIESIKHWKNVLKKMNESQSLLIDALCRKFGEDIVKSCERNVILTSDLCYSILDALNPILFDNALKHIPIKCMSCIDIIADCIKNDKRHKIYNYKYDLNKFLGLFTTYIETEDPTVEELSFDDKLISKDSMIYINYDKVYNTSFIFAVATLCHELIHYYDSLFGEYKEVKRLVAMGKIDKKHELKAEHQTKTFLEKMLKANDQNLNVIISGNGKPIDVLDMNAINNMKKAFIAENQDDAKIVPEKSTNGVHIYNGRSFRSYSW